MISSDNFDYVLEFDRSFPPEIFTRSVDDYRDGFSVEIVVYRRFSDISCRLMIGEKMLSCLIFRSERRVRFPGCVESRLRTEIRIQEIVQYVEVGSESKCIVGAIT